MKLNDIRSHAEQAIGAVLPQRRHDRHGLLAANAPVRPR